MVASVWGAACAGCISVLAAVVVDVWTAVLAVRYLVDEQGAACATGPAHNFAWAAAIIACITVLQLVLGTTFSFIR